MRNNLPMAATVKPPGRSVWAMSDIGAVYAEGRERISEIVTALEPDQQRTAVPGCPEWTVHDVVAHLSGVCADILAGNLEGVATDPWTAEQVRGRREWP